MLQDGGRGSGRPRLMLRAMFSMHLPWNSASHGLPPLPRGTAAGEEAATVVVIRDMQDARDSSPWKAVRAKSRAKSQSQVDIQGFTAGFRSAGFEANVADVGSPPNAWTTPSHSSTTQPVSSP
mmetsp:Transcript_16273/g.46313  ORF Transcript_16273/g.46313 Transcript_16273/m.46313 type:complete len:123 (-) Transcript_16273:2274-2642(-)